MGRLRVKPARPVPPFIDFSTPVPLLVWCFQAREVLSVKLPTWQEKCCDITKVPDTVMSMIEGLATTPEQSPLVDRCKRVSVSCSQGRFTVSRLQAWPVRYGYMSGYHMNNLFTYLLLCVITYFDPHLTVR